MNCVISSQVGITAVSTAGSVRKAAVVTLELTLRVYVHITL